MTAAGLSALPQTIFAIMLTLSAIGIGIGNRPPHNPQRDAMGLVFLVALLIWGGFFRVWGLG